MMGELTEDFLSNPELAAKKKPEVDFNLIYRINGILEMISKAHLGKFADYCIQTPKFYLIIISISYSLTRVRKLKLRDSFRRISEVLSIQQMIGE